MSKYSKYISISEQFKNSVNIEYDLAKYEKLAAYIPTEDACEVLQYYINSIENNRYNRSTILEGPYGKGKSYLVLTLLQLLQLDEKDCNVRAFLDKLKEVNQHLHDEYLRMKSNGLKLLPVIINSNYSRLPQALNMALKDALNRVGLEDLFPDTAYEVAINVIEQWENKPDYDEKVMEKCLETTGMSIEAIKMGIREYDQEIFKKFVELYNCVVIGLSFNPFSSDDVVKNYSDISYKLSNYGYTGIFVVFDEFSKFIEAENKDLSLDLKVLQDLAEKANRSEKIGQMHLCCITHKSLHSYYKNKKEITANAFRTVEGRFKEVRFNRSLNQNYQIISLTLEKNDGFDKLFDDFYKKHEGFYNDVCNSSVFDEVNYNNLTKGCFPLNPLTTFAVVNISELVAQNERTLFTFISDNDVNSLSTFINNNDDGLFNVDKVYDYFANLIEKADDDIRKLNYKAQVCLSKVSGNLSKRIIKVLAIIKIINDNNYLPTSSTISSSLNIYEKEVQIELNHLVDEKLLKKSFVTDSYDFALPGSKFIDTKVDAFMASKAKIENLSSVLNGIFDSTFELPRKYNTKHKMTRFYRCKYIADIELMNLNSFEVFFKKEFSDGIIFKVINTGIDLDLIAKHYNEIESKDTVILHLENDVIDKKIVNEVFRINALQSILTEKNIDDNVVSEARLIINEEVNELEQVLRNVFSKKNTNVLSSCECTSYPSLLSEIMENVYYCTPIVNNEMINKESDISAQYIKPRNTIVNLYLNKRVNNDHDTIEGFSSTSQESTVFNSIKETESLEKRTVLNEIKTFIYNCEIERRCALDIIGRLKGAPYGIRSGVLPLLFAMAISELDDNVLFYFDKKEIDLNADNINKMVANPNKYFFGLEKGSIEKDDYLRSLLKIFNLSSTNSYRGDIKLIFVYMQKWVMSLPRIIQIQTRTSNFLELDPSLIELKSVFTGFNINEHEALFEKLPRVFGDDYKKTVSAINNFRDSVDDIINLFSNNLAARIKKIFNADVHSSLLSTLEDWVYDSKANQRILEDKEKTFISLLDAKDYDDISMMNSISKNLVRIKIADWDKDNTKEILDFIEQLSISIRDRKLTSEIIKTDIISSGTEDNNEISVMGNMLMNNIEEALDEFGESVSNEEKIRILTKLIKEMI